MRHTGGDRRRRLPAPREQHRHEQLEPLQAHAESLFTRSNWVGRSARAPPGAAAGWPRLPRPDQTDQDCKTAKPGKRAGEKDGSVRRVHGDVRPAARRSVLNYGMAATLRQRGFVCTRWAVVRVQEGPTRAPPTTRPAHASLRGRAVQCDCCLWVVSRGHQRRRAATSDGVRHGDAPRWPWRSPAPAGAKRAGRSIGRLLGGK